MARPPSVSDISLMGRELLCFWTAWIRACNLNMGPTKLAYCFFSYRTHKWLFHIADRICSVMSNRLSISRVYCADNTEFIKLIINSNPIWCAFSQHWHVRSRASTTKLHIDWFELSNTFVSQVQSIKRWQSDLHGPEQTSETQKHAEGHWWVWSEKFIKLVQASTHENC